MTKIKIAIISDLHIGNGTRAIDFSPHKDRRGLDYEYKKTFLDFLKKEKLKANYLIVPGDISNAADFIELKLGSELIKDFAKSLSVKSNNILFVPGNHDVDWDPLRETDLEELSYKRKKRYDPFMEKEFIFHKINKSGKGSLFIPPYFKIWEYSDSIFVGYNSSYHDEPEVFPHHGDVNRDFLQEMEKALNEVNLKTNKLKVFIVHHHPIQYKDPIPGKPDFSIMNNSEALLDLLNKFKFDLLIHGHKHAPFFSTRIKNSNFPLAILCCGSFSALLDTRWSGFVNNQFHFIEIDERDIKTGYISGVVYSWAFLSGKGWTPSYKNNGILHKLPFGSYYHPKILKEEIIDLLKIRFETGNYSTWNDLLKEKPELKNVQMETLHQILDEISIEMKFDIHQTDREIIILKK